MNNGKTPSPSSFHRFSKDGKDTWLSLRPLSPRFRLFDATRLFVSFPPYDHVIFE
jgi:hypothetical protein